MSRIQRNWLFIFASILFLVILYMNYKINLYTFFCEQESNAPACFVLSKELSESGNASKAQRYLKISCDMKYEIACDKLAKKNESK